MCTLLWCIVQETVKEKATDLWSIWIHESFWLNFDLCQAFAQFAAVLSHLFWHHGCGCWSPISSWWPVPTRSLPNIYFFFFGEILYANKNCVLCVCFVFFREKKSKESSNNNHSCNKQHIFLGPGSTWRISSDHPSKWPASLIWQEAPFLLSRLKVKLVAKTKSPRHQPTCSAASMWYTAFSLGFQKPLLMWTVSTEKASILSTWKIETCVTVQS